MPKTIKEIQQILDSYKRGSQLCIDKLPPGEYLFFAQEEGKVEWVNLLDIDILKYDEKIGMMVIGGMGDVYYVLPEGDVYIVVIN